MKTLLKWIIKKYISKDSLKKALHSANEALARKEVDETKKKVIAVCEDASNVLAVYLNGYADDGRIDAEELEACDEACDKMLDKYLADDAVDSFIDKIFA